jgi:hypothetical protein
MQILVWWFDSCPCRYHTLAYELHLDLAPTSALCTASDAVQPSAAAPAAAVPSLVAATGSRDARALCVAVWLMLGDHLSHAAGLMSQTVVTWATAHLASLGAGSEEEDDPLAWAALYVPSRHVVRDAGTAPSHASGLHWSAWAHDKQQHTHESFSEA